MSGGMTKEPGNRTAVKEKKMFSKKVRIPCGDCGDVSAYIGVIVMFHLEHKCPCMRGYTQTCVNACQIGVLVQSQMREEDKNDD